MAVRAFHFTLPAALNATAPPERRGLRRDQIRLLVLDRESGATAHSRFDQLGKFLDPGDLIVLNNSRTLPAVLQATGLDGAPVQIRLAHRIAPDRWRALLVSDAPIAQGMRLLLAEGLEATITTHPNDEPLSQIHFSRGATALYDTLYRIGQPIRYEYIAEPWDLDYYQTVFASAPGSVEMPSAGRPFTWELLLNLRRRGIETAYLSLHTGLSYYLDPRWEKDPRQAPEEYSIPSGAASRINEAKRRGNRVIAVGTTVVRALESAVNSAGELAAESGWSDLFIDQHHQLRVVDGLLTGLHEPEASHLDLLSAFMRPDRLHTAYEEAVRLGYLWHEFGDANLIFSQGGGSGA